jgi:hypothetical protein
MDDAEDFDTSDFDCGAAVAAILTTRFEGADIRARSKLFIRLAENGGTTIRVTESEDDV